MTRLIKLALKPAIIKSSWVSVVKEAKGALLKQVADKGDSLASSNKLHNCLSTARRKRHIGSIGSAAIYNSKNSIMAASRGALPVFIERAQHTSAHDQGTVSKTSNFSSFPQRKTDSTIHSSSSASQSQSQAPHKLKSETTQHHSSDNLSKSPTEQTAPNSSTDIPKNDGAEQVLATPLHQQCPLRKEIPPNSNMSLRELIKSYGKAALLTHVTISCLTVTSFYAAIRAGLDPQVITKTLTSFFNTVGIKVDIESSRLVGGAGSYMLAFGLYKLVFPFRAAATVGFTTFLVRNGFITSKSKPSPSVPADVDPFSPPAVVEEETREALPTAGKQREIQKDVEMPPQRPDRKL